MRRPVSRAGGRRIAAPRPADRRLTLLVRRTMVNRLATARRDPALSQAVLIGHSLGGLLAKLRVVQRQLQGERRAASQAPAARFDGTAVGLHYLPHDGQPQAEAAVPARGRAVRLPEGLEDVR